MATVPEEIAAPTPSSTYIFHPFRTHSTATTSSQSSAPSLKLRSTSQSQRSTAANVVKSAGRWFKRLLTGGSIDSLSPGASKDEEERLQDFRAEEEERMGMWRVMSVGYENAGQYVDVSEWVGLYRLGVFP